MLLIFPLSNIVSAKFCMLIRICFYASKTGLLLMTNVIESLHITELISSSIVHSFFRRMMSTMLFGLRSATWSDEISSVVYGRSGSALFAIIGNSRKTAPKVNDKKRETFNLIRNWVMGSSINSCTRWELICCAVWNINIIDG